MEFRTAIYTLFCALIVCTSCENREARLYKLRPSSDTGIRFANTIVENDSLNILNEEYIFNGGGVAVVDVNNDGLSDLFFTGNQVGNKLYMNMGGFKFLDVSEIAGIEGANRWSTGVAVVDINTDGWMDIYVCAAINSNKSNMLYVNKGLDSDGMPQFEDQARKYGIDEPGNSMGATFFDYNRDGLLDLYVLNNEQTSIAPTNYRPKIVDGSAKSNDRLFRNNGDGTFSDVTLEAGIVYEGFGLGIAVSDVNYDGWPDLHISNDYLTNNLLYLNNGDGTFSNNIGDYIKHQSKFSMGSDIADFNNDGFLDLITLDMLGETNYRRKTTIGRTNYIGYILNERWDYEYQYSRNMLHLGNGPDIPFNEIGLLAGIASTDWSWSPLFIDVDNDGFRDLLITNGFPRDVTDRDFADFRVNTEPFASSDKLLDSIPVAKLPNYAFKNQKDGTFSDVGHTWGLDLPSFSNGAAYVDLDNDGDMDYVVNNINGEAFVFENTLKKEASNKYLKVKLKGPESNRLGIGAKLVVKYNQNDLQYHEQYLTRGYMSSVDANVHFGVGSNDCIESIEVLWPDGTYEKLRR